MKNIAINGDPRGHERFGLIAEAIRLIQEKPTEAMAQGYLGIKNYSSFGDQREDHKYGYGPRHGAIVFSIGRCDRANTVALGSDEIYLLEAYRDFAPVMREVYEHGRREKKPFPLTAAIRHFDKLRAECDEFEAAFESAVIESHEPQVVGQ